MMRCVKGIVFSLCMFGLVFLVSGCQFSTTSSSSSNTDEGTNTNAKSSSKEELSDNVEASAAVTKKNNLVVFVTNNNDETVDIHIEVEYYDADGVIAGSSEDYADGVPAGAKIAVETTTAPDSWSTYKVYADATATYYTSYYNDITLTHNDNGEHVVAQATNNSDTTIDSITAVIVYYKGEEVVGADTEYGSDIASGRSANFTFYYPENTEWEDVDFDTYEIYLLEAYNYTY